VAQSFARAHELRLQFEPELREMNFGQWDGIAFDAMPPEQWQQLENFWQQPAQVTPPQGETLQLFQRRVVRAWERMCAHNPGEHQLVICHGGVIRIILAHILGLDYTSPQLFQQLHLGYTSHSRIELGSHPQAQPLVKWIGAPLLHT
jgi:alpha-ribazole phosphatase